MPPKKRGQSNKRILLITVTIFVIVLSYGVYSYFSSRDNSVPAPSPSSFKSERWMTFIPADVERFNYLNITKLTKFPGLFTSITALSISELQLNITINEIVYMLEVETHDNVVVNILSVNATTANRISKAFTNSSLPSTTYKDTSIYRIKPSTVSQENVAWVSVFNGTIIYCEGDRPALQAVESVMDASTGNFFSSDAFKVGYLLTRSGQEYLAFSFFRFEGNDLNIKWTMMSAFGFSEITKREVFSLASKDDVTAKYQAVVQNLLLKSKRVYTSENFIIGEFVYPSTEIRSVLLEM